MGFKDTLEKQTVKIAPKIIKVGAKLTPKILVSWVANIVLKGIAEFSKISYDLDKRTAFVEVTLYGEEESIQVDVDGFEILGEEGNYQFILHKAESNKPWMTNMLARIAGKPWDIPDIPKYRLQLEIIANLLKGESDEQETELQQKPEQEAAK